MKKVLFAIVLMLGVMGTAFGTDIYVGKKNVSADTSISMIEVSVITGMGTQVVVDYGQKMSNATFNSKKNRLADENGKQVKIKSTIALMNYFKEAGWELVDQNESRGSSSYDTGMGVTINSAVTKYLFQR